MFVGGNLGFWGVGGSLPWNTWTGANDGSPVNFDTVNTTANAPSSSLKTVEVSAGTILTLYVKGTAFYAIAGIVSGTNITYGTPVVVNSSLGVNPVVGLCKMSDGVALALTGGGTSATDATNVLTVSGTTVTVNSSGGDWAGGKDPGWAIGLCALSSTNAVVSFAIANHGYCLLITVSGTTASCGATQEFGGYTSTASLCALTSTTALLLFYYSGLVRSLVVTLSGSTLSFSALSNTLVPSNASDSCYLAKIDNATAIACGLEQITHALYVAVITVSGGVPTIGTAATVTVGYDNSDALCLGYIATGSTTGGGIVGVPSAMFGYKVVGTTVTLSSLVNAGTYTYPGTGCTNVATMAETNTFVLSYATTSSSTAQGTSKVISN